MNLIDMNLIDTVLINELCENVNLDDYDVCVDELLKLRSMYEEK